MNEKDAPSTELVPFTAIRVETVLSRFPVHRLATRGNVQSICRSRTKLATTTLNWKVDYSATYGQPGPWPTSSIRSSSTAGSKKPGHVCRGLLRLGSLSDICKELSLADSGKNRANIKNALLQNAFAGIVPLISYNLADGSENTLDTAFNRYALFSPARSYPTDRKPMPFILF